MGPNILLVVFDTARRDALEPYGAPSAATPAVAQLASRGMALPQAYATASWTLPSHGSMFTGMLPRRLGLGQAPDGTPQSARAALQRVSERMLPEVLRRAGYATQGWSTNVWASGHAGFDIGFDRLEYVTSGRDERMNALLAGGARAQLAWAMEGLRSRSDDGAAAVGRQLRGAIQRWSGQPTFWFVNLSECHSPYLPPRPWNDLGPRDRVRAALDSKRHLNFLSICLFVAGRHEVPDDSFARMRHLYGRAVSYMDDWLAGVLEALDGRGILDDTLVIVTSDHGENFGEGGLIAHGFSLDQRLIHVPLVMAGPGALASDRVISLAELPRVIADAAGLEQAPWSDEQLPEGVAVAQFDPLGAADHPRVRDFATRFDLDQHGIDRLSASFTSVTDGIRKLVVRNDEQLLYDLAADPGEIAPIEPSPAGASMAAVRDALVHPAVTAAAADDEPVAVGGAPSASEEELAAIERQMKLLGYM